MKLSIPNPTRDMLPAIIPATTATRPSSTFHPIVKYSSPRPRRAAPARSSRISSPMVVLKSSGTLLRLRTRAGVASVRNSFRSTHALSRRIDVNPSSHLLRLPLAGTIHRQFALAPCRHPRFQHPHSPRGDVHGLHLQNLSPPHYDMKAKPIRTKQPP